MLGIRKRVAQKDIRMNSETENTPNGVMKSGPPREPTDKMIRAIGAVHRPGWSIAWSTVWRTMYDAWAQSQEGKPDSGSAGVSDSDKGFNEYRRITFTDLRHAGPQQSKSEINA